MRRAGLSMILLLLLGACGSGGGEGGGGGGGEGPGGDPLAGLDPTAPPDPARLQAIVDRAIPAALPDAAGARYRGIRAGVAGSVCGEVATGSDGPFRPFVVNPSGLPLVAPGPTIAFDDPSNLLADAWIRWCASPEELQRLEPELQKAARSAVGAGLPPSDAPPLEMPLELPPPDIAAAPPAPPPAPPREERKAAAPPPPAQIDSFFNSIERARE
jgi:hypothetical protein